jgi:glycine betaine catabolism B
MTTLRLIRKHHVTGNVWSFFFAPSAPLTWTAGQFVRIEVPHATPDAEGTKRQFTIASAPHEDHLQISTRLTDTTFKQALAALPEGGEAGLLDPPAGDFIWPQAPGANPTFVAQGIGITPFYSMLRDRLHRGLPLAATLIYANRSPLVPFRDEISGWAHRHSEFKPYFIDGPATATIIAATRPGFATQPVYVSGPRSFIELLGPPYNLPGKLLKQDVFPNYPAGAY